MTSSDSQRSRRRVMMQIGVVVILLLAAALRPRIEPWLAANFPQLTAPEDRATEVGPLAAESANDVQSTDPERLDPSSADRTRTDASATDNTRSTRLPVDTPSSADLSRQFGGTTTVEHVTGASASRESGDEPPPGQLKLVGKNVFRSAAGLIYRPGSRDGHRLKHILKHSKDDLQKPVHGVFRGDRDQILKWIDLAWIQAGKGGKRVRRREQNRRTAWTVNMREDIGYTGGQRGQERRQPACQFLRLVLEDDGETVVTAYPVSSF